MNRDGVGGAAGGGLHATGGQPDGRTGADRGGVSLILCLDRGDRREAVERIGRAMDCLDRRGAPFEILAVGATPEAAAAVHALAGAAGRVRLIDGPRDGSRSAGVRRAAGQAHGDVVVLVEPGGAAWLDQLDGLIGLCRQGLAVFGYRAAWARRPAARVVGWLYRAAAALLGGRLRDPACPVNGAPRSLWRLAAAEPSTGDLTADLLLAARQAAVPVAETALPPRPREAEAAEAERPRRLAARAADAVRGWWQRVAFPEPQPPEARRARRPAWPAALVLAALTLLVLPLNLAYPLVDPDETRNTEVALEMLSSGDYLTPRLDGRPHLDKPPLLFWLSAASMRAFGVCEWAARLPSTVAAMLTVLGVAWLGAPLVGRRGAWLGALMLLLSCGFLLAGRFLIMDSLLTLCVAVTYLALRRGRLSGRRHLGWSLLAGLACGVGLLAKGPICPVLALPPAWLHAWLNRGREPAGGTAWPVFAAAAALPATPWYAAISIAQPEFVGYFFWRHHVLRFTTDFHHSGGWWYYIPVLFAGLFPSSLLLPQLIGFLAARDEAQRRLRHAELGYLLLGAGWVIGFFTLSKGKLPTYILPALPMLTLVLGGMLDSGVLGRRRAPALTHAVRLVPPTASLLLLATIAGLAAAMLVLDGHPPGRAAFHGAVLAAALLLSAAAAVAGRRRWRAQPGAWAAAGAVTLAAAVYGFGVFFPRAAELRSIAREAALAARSDPASPLPVVFYDHPAHAARMYLGSRGYVRLESHQLRRLKALVDRRGAAVIVLDDNLADKLQQLLGPRYRLQSTGGRDRVYLARTNAPGRAAAARVAVRPSRPEGR